MLNLECYVYFGKPWYLNSTLAARALHLGYDLNLDPFFDGILGNNKTIFHKRFRFIHNIFRV